MSSTPELRTAILTILAKSDGWDGWMTLETLRAKFGTAISRESLDQALIDLLDGQQIRLIPESNQKTLTAAQRSAALWLGGEYRHLARIN